ncbi:MAG: hypothetical protein HKN23_09835 [Verrucomicrobiales bacterium]|nr:hypothetical protein [Verrucomicrobiales bacterium]
MNRVSCLAIALLSVVFFHFPVSSRAGDDVAASPQSHHSHEGKFDLKCFFRGIGKAFTKIVSSREPTRDRRKDASLAKND